MAAEAWPLLAAMLGFSPCSFYLHELGSVGSPDGLQKAMGTITLHVWLKCLPLQVVSAVAPCFAVQEEGVVMVQCQPLCAKQMPMHEGVVNSLEGEAAQESNLFLQGDFSSPCFKSRISIAACWCPPTE